MTVELEKTMVVKVKGTDEKMRINVKDFDLEKHETVGEGKPSVTVK